MSKLYPLRWLCTLLLLLFTTPLLLGATIVVTSTGDSGDGTLREAVASAVAGDVIRFDVSTNGTPINLTGALILIDKSIEIAGNGMDQTIISGASTNRIFTVDGNVTVRIAKLTVRDGVALIGGGIRVRAGSTLRMENAIIRNNSATGVASTQGGGGIYNQGTVFLRRVMITENTALGTAGSGGGIFNAPGGFLQIALSNISNNQANRAGGGIEDASEGTDETVIGSSFILNNSALSGPGNGGGIHVGGSGNLRMEACQVNSNVASSEGGGVWMGTGLLQIRSTLVSDNEAQGNAADQGGGGLYNEGGTMRVDPGTRVSDNRATGTLGSGGGILNNQTPGTEGPIRGSLRLNAAVVANNTAMRAGGGIEDASGANSRFFVYNSRVDSNVVMTSPGNGGGIHIGGDGNSFIVLSSVSGNTAGQEGGGLWNGVGRMDVRRTVVDNNEAAGDDATQGGGGIYNNGGTLFVNPNTRVSNNRATGASGSGGGVLNAATTVDEVEFPGTLFVNNAVIVSNTAVRAGGGIEDASGSASRFFIQNAVIDSNTVASNPGNGGGIHIGGDGNLLIRTSQVRVNSASSQGGGIWGGTGTITVTAGTFTENTTSGTASTEGGGGFYTDGGSLAISGATITDNMAVSAAEGAAPSGGAILIAPGGSLSLNQSVLTGNMANRAGGAIEDASGAAGITIITNSTIDDNMALANPGNGGAIHVGGEGDLIMTGGSVSGNTAATDGGGLWNGTGIMTLSNLTINGNEASGDGTVDDIQGGGGIYNDGGAVEILGVSVISDNTASGVAGSGGGILSGGEAATISPKSIILRGGTVSGNSAVRAGGGVEIVLGDFTSNDVIFDGNRASAAPGNGGALHVSGTESNTDINGGVVANNSAANEGGGLWNMMGSFMEVTNVSIMNNSVYSATLGTDQVLAGGGIYNDGGDLNLVRSTVFNNTVVTGDSLELSGTGGGIANAGTSGDFSVTASTVTGNSAETGGGIFSSTNARIENSTVVANTATTGGGVATSESLLIQGSILSANTADTDANLNRSGGTTTSAGFNFFGTEVGDDITLNTANGDITGADPDLGDLSDNGGTTMTLKPNCGSPIVGTGDPADSSLDQLGQSVVGVRDIGSYELQESCASATGSQAGVQSSAMTTTSDEVTIYPNPVSGDQIRVSLPARFVSDISLRVMDASGRVLQLTTRQGAGTHRVQLDGYKDGTYILQVVSGDEVENFRFVVSK
ncbi:hypothetical protein LEM8419_00245 [Neolewinella maritima]|uniref:Secretion system C-terminal sorting domain-containing protein n=1 Tax=Neolewinella maritima TaxID=1383882 RepID=A0ABN8F4V2_9BACT|nr:T9SS type A sorting domain-containing protein [Neolewinella maritima]CAH0998950.1 hypothetical protein LEM8419_00245 [Neolewinella maritima]